MPPPRTGAGLPTGGLPTAGLRPGDLRPGDLRPGDLRPGDLRTGDLGGPAARWLLTRRAGGVSRPPFDGLNLGPAVGDDPAAVAENRRRVAAAAGLADVLWMHQVHGTEVAVVTGPDADTRGVDALVTRTPGLGLAVLTADCVPVLLADPAVGVVAAAHAGRRGAADGILPAVLAAMAGLGARPSGTTALLGPAVCGGCYPVPAELVRQVGSTLPGSATTAADGSPALDLRAGLAAQLRQAGVAEVVADPACTVEDPGLFSYRREPVTGRLGALVWLAK